MAGCSGYRRWPGAASQAITGGQVNQVNRTNMFSISCLLMLLVLGSKESAYFVYSL